MSDVVQSFEHNGYTIEICYDQDSESPRDWDNVGTMVCFHKRYNLGDKHELQSSQFSSFEELRSYLVKHEDAELILPLYMMDHSGLSIRTSCEQFRACDSMAWDWGQIGFIYVSRKRMLEEWGRKNLTKAVLEKATKYLIGEVETYDQYSSGQVYCYAVKDSDDEVVDSLCGVYDLDYCIEQAKEAADAAAKHAAQNAEVAYG